MITFFGYSWLTRHRISKAQYHYRVRFEELGWVNKGDPVLLKGVIKGKVENILFYPESVIVEITIEDIQLREGAFGILLSSGIVGQMRLSLTLGEGKPLPEGTTIPGYKERSLGEIIAALGMVLDTVQLTLSDLRRLIVHTDSNITRATDELLETAHELRQMVASSAERLDSTQVVLLEKIDRVIALADSISAGRGTLGRLTTDESLYMELDSAVNELRVLLRDIRERPKRYVNVKVKLF